MKHPVLEKGSKHLIWWLVWLFLGLGQSLIYYYAYGSYNFITIPEGIISVCIYSGIALMLWYPFSYFNRSVTNLGVVIINFILAGGISVTLWVLLTKFLTSSVFQKDPSFKAYWDATLPYRIGTGIFIFGLVILTYYLIISLNNLAEKKARESKLESLVKETELKMLRSQINPHFLFNSLNSISSLTITDPEKARTMVIKLSEFLRYALSRKDEQPVTLKSELENLRLYLDIEKIRFGNRLISEESITEDCYNVLLPVMLLQPLYENAVKHGVYESLDMVKIVTHAEIRSGFLNISISNNFDPDAVPLKGTGTGLLNVGRRLELVYGKKGLITTKKENNIFSVNISVPVNIK
jgi:two-component system, LytTR family, sensor kinase